MGILAGKVGGVCGSSPLLFPCDENQWRGKRPRFRLTDPTGGPPTRRRKSIDSKPTEARASEKTAPLAEVRTRRTPPFCAASIRKSKQRRWKRSVAGVLGPWTDGDASLVSCFFCPGEAAPWFDVTHREPALAAPHPDTAESSLAEGVLLT